MLATSAPAPYHLTPFKTIYLTNIAYKGGWGYKEALCCSYFSSSLKWKFPKKNNSSRLSWFLPQLVIFWKDQLGTRLQCSDRSAIIIALHHHREDKDACSLQFSWHPNICLWLIGVTASLISIFRVPASISVNCPKSASALHSELSTGLMSEIKTEVI